MEKEKKSIFAIISGSLFIVYTPFAFWQFMKFLMLWKHQINAFKEFDITVDTSWLIKYFFEECFALTCNVATGIFLLFNKKKAVLVTLLLILIESVYACIYLCINGLLYGGALLTTASLVAIFVLSIFSLKKNEKLSFILGIISIILFAGLCLLNIIVCSFEFINSFFSIMYYSAMILCAIWLMFPKGFSYNIQGQFDHDETGYIDMAKHVLLLIFTFGVYYIIWINRTTAYLNKENSEPPRIPASQTLLCIFVPFYSIYWIYKSSQRIERLSAKKNIETGFTTILLVIGIFAPFIAYILLQDKINTFSLSPQFRNAAGQYAPPPFYNSHVDPRNQYMASGYNNTQQPYVNAVPNPQQQYLYAKPSVVREDNKAAEEKNDPLTQLKMNKELLNQYKEMLDNGIISQEDFDTKKKQLLGF